MHFYSLNINININILSQSHIVILLHKLSHELQEKWSVPTTTFTYGHKFM